MKRTRFLGLLFVLSVPTTPAGARALTVVVPDDFPTIQQALDSGADVVTVKDGTYSENVVVRRSVELRAHEPDLGYPIAFPQIDGSLAFDFGALSAQATVVGFWIVGPVTLNSGSFGVQTIRECRLDAGIVGGHPAGSPLRVRGCTIRGDVSSLGYHCEVTNSTVLGGGILANYEGEGPIRHNVVIGPAPFGIDLNGNDGSGSIHGNLVKDTEVGIIATMPSGMRISANEVLGCADDAYRGRGGPLAHFISNRAMGCGGDGFDLEVGSAVLQENSVLNAGGVGVRASPHAVVTARANTVDGTGARGMQLGRVVEFTGNRVLRAGGEGIVLDVAEGPVENNVIGRSSGLGLAVLDEGSPAILRRNTVYLNAGDGMRIAGAAGTTIENNILHGNGGFGVAWTSAATPALGCNDYFDNVAGALLGAAPAPSDLMVNPLFCDLPADDVTLGATSPLVGTACGQIGAAGVGCAAPVDAPAGAGVEIPFSAWPTPARGRVTLAWKPLEAPGHLEVFDIRGARVWGRPVPRLERTCTWTPTGLTGAGLPAGVYFARLDRGRERSVVRMVLTR